MERGIFDQPDAHRTLALEVEGRKIWVSRETLASSSPVFKKMLYGEFEEGKKDAIRLPYKKADDIEQLMLLLHPGLLRLQGRKNEITEDNLDSMLALADEYELDTIKSYAEQYLINKMVTVIRKEDEMLDMLRLGSKYRLKNVLFQYIKRCAVKINIQKFGPSIPELRSEIVAAFMLYAHLAPEDGKCRFVTAPINAVVGTACKCGRVINSTGICTICGEKRNICNHCGRHNGTLDQFCSMQPLENAVRELLDRM